MMLEVRAGRCSQFLLPLSSECFVYSCVKLMSLCVGVKFGVLCQVKNTDLGGAENS